MSKRKVQTERRKYYDEELMERQSDREAMQRLCAYSWAQATEPMETPFGVTFLSSDRFEVESC